LERHPTPSERENERGADIAKRQKRSSAMLSWKDALKIMLKAKAAAGDIDKDRILDAVHADEMREYLADHLLGVRKRSTFAVIAESTGFIMLGVVIGGGIAYLLARDQPARQVVGSVTDRLRRQADELRREAVHTYERAEGAVSQRIENPAGHNGARDIK
jgi:hypothetical protein